MRKLFAISALLITACCVRPTQPPPEQVVAAPPAPVTRPPVQLGPDWRDWPVTPGNWSYARSGAGTSASYGRGVGAPDLALRCDPAQRQVTIALSSPAPAAQPIQVRTTNADRSLAAAPGAGALEAALPASDPLLDAMAFSRGRFMVSVGGAPNVIAPAWPEVARVVEDCRS